jgi:diamine N-acetyltransferase
MMQTYLIRKIEPEEYYQWKVDRDNQVNLIWVRAIQREIAHGHRLVFICTKKSKYIGRGELVMEHSDPDYTIPHKRIHLSILCVRPEAMCQGVGSALIDHLADYCKSIGYEEISIGVNLNNQNARKLYDRKGFTEVIGEGEDEDGKYIQLLKKLRIV